jgi:putative redox protein
MASETLRSVQIDRVSLGRYRAQNARGGSLTFGDSDAGEFSAVELLLVASAGCTAADVDHITVKRSEPDAFTVTVTGDKIRDDGGNRMTNLAVTFEVTFPEGEAGDAARAVLPRAVQQSHDRLCTVTRTIELGTPIANRY